MHVAVAGSGSIAQYISEEFPKYGHEVVVLTRTEKPFFKCLPSVRQVVTDYSNSSVQSAIENCEVLISTILSYTSEFIDVHKNLIGACKNSSKCKRFIPSEYGGNLEDYPDVPLFYYQTREPVREILREQTELEWTLVSVGWLMDYIVPQRNRYLQSPGEAFFIDIDRSNVIIPGSGKEPIDLLAARDLARALALLVAAPSWDRYIYISGQKTCWNDVLKVIQPRYPEIGDVKYLGLGRILDTIQTSKDEMEILTAHYQIFVPLGAGSLDAEKVETHRRKYFPSVQFRSPEDLLDEVAQVPNVIV